MVRIGHIPILLAHKFVPWHFAHRGEQTFIANATLPQLAFHHRKAFGCERLCAIAVHASLFPSAYVNIETQDTILVSYRYDGYVLINIVFHLNDGLR